MSKMISIPVVDDPDDLTEEQIAYLLQMGPLVSAWLKAVKEIAMQRINENKVVPGWQLAPGKRSRAWNDEAAATAAMGRAGINDPYAHTLKSPAVAEKEVGDEMKKQMEEGWSWHAGSPSLKQSAGAKASSVSLDVFKGVSKFNTGFGW